MENTIGKQFIEMTKYPNLEPSIQSQGAPYPEVSLPAPQGADMIDLPDGRLLPLEKLDLIKLVEKRETLRLYSEASLSLQELSYLLWGTQGVKGIRPDKPLTKRTVPGAGSFHEFETYLLVNRVDGLEPGLYRYLAPEHKLARLQAPQGIALILAEACNNQPHVGNSAVTFFWTAVMGRITYRFSERGYRFIFLDAGHICQNLYLLAESIGCGVCAIAAYNDDLVNQALGIDGREQLTAYIAALGKRKSGA